MTRRSLFGLLAGAIIGATLDPERLLWVPGAKLISIPAPRYPNRILTQEILSRLALETLYDNLQAVWETNRAINRQLLDLGYRGALGSIVKIRRPYRFVTA